MNNFYISFLLFGWMLFFSFAPSSLFSQDKRSNGAELFAGFGPSAITASDGEAEALSVNYQGGLQLGANFLLGLNSKLAFGLGVRLNNGSFLAGLPRFAPPGAPATHPNIDTSFAFTQTLVATDVEENLEYSEIVLSPFIDYVISEGKIEPYVQVGVSLKLPSATFQNTSGSLSKEATFPELPREDGTGTFALTISDLPKYGFDSGITISDTPKDLPMNSTAFAVNANIGVRFNISSSFYAFLQGGISQSATIASFNTNQYTPSSSSDEHNSVLNSTGSISIRDIKGRAGFGFLFGPSPNNKVVPPQFIQKVPIEFVQTEGKRRNSGQSDPEFELIAPKILRSLDFKPSSYSIDVNLIETELSFDKREGSPAAITVSTKVKDSYMELLPYDSKFAQNAYQVHLSTPNNKSLKMALVDQDTESEVDGFDVELFMVHPAKGDVLIHKKEKVNSGYFIPKLYDHPEITYKLKLSHLCYEPEIATISSVDFSGTKAIQAESKGEAEEIIIRVDQMGGDAFMRIQGTIQERNRTTPLSGTISGNEITLYAGCGQAPNKNYQLTLEKPLGYNLRTGSSASNWKQANVRINMENGEPKSNQPLKLEALSTYNLFYVDIGEFQNRNRPRRSILSQVNTLTESGQEIFVYLSDGTSPYTASTSQELPSVLSKIALIFPDVPKAETDRDLLIKRINIPEIMPSRRIVNLHFYLGRTLYETSRNELINELTKAFPTGRENVKIFIYTDFEVSNSQKLERGVYKTPITYIHLK